MFHIVLVSPEIPHNAGAAGRLALATGSSLHLVKPLGFSLDDKHVRRAGLDYWHEVDLHVWETWQDFQHAMGDQRKYWYFSTKGKKSLYQASFRAGDCLIFGCETKGLPKDWIEQTDPDYLLTIPMKPGSTRSLNLSTSIAIGLFEALRQEGFSWDV